MTYLAHRPVSLTPPDTATIGEEHFRGLEAGTNTDLIPPGFVQQADNCLLLGAAEGGGGVWSIRPGKRGRLSSLLGFNFYNALPYRKADGSQIGIFVAGDGTDTAGRIYSWVKDATTATYKSAIGTFKETQVQLARLGKYVFLTGAVGSSGVKLRRYDPEADSTDTCDGIATPSYVPSASVTNRTLKDGQGPPAAIFQTASKWKADTVSASALSITQASFANGYTVGQAAGNPLCYTGPGATNPINAWDIVGGSVECDSGADIDATFPAVVFVRLDESGSSIKTNANVLITNATKSNTNGVGAATRYAQHGVFSCRLSNTYAAETVDVIISAYDNSGVFQTSIRKTLESNGAGLAANRYFYFSFADQMDDTVGPVKYGIQFIAGNANHSGQNGAYVSVVGLHPFEPTVAFTVAASVMQVAAAYKDASLTPAEAVDPQTVYLGDNHLSFYTTSIPATSLASVSRFAIPWTEYVPLNNLHVRLGIRETSNGAFAYTNELTKVMDDAGNLWLTGDLSTISPSVRDDDTRYIDLHFLTNPTIAPGYTNSGQPLFAVGAMTEAGGLSVGYAPYSYKVVEKASATSLASGGSASTVQIVPLSYLATGQLTLPSTFALGSGADTLVVYRAGGTFADGLYRKVAEFVPGADRSGTYWDYTNSTKVFADRTPDSVLRADESGATDFFFSDHQPPPTDIKAIAVKDGRLFAATADALWVSQQVANVAAIGLYWNRVNDPTAPDFITQGFYTRLSGADGSNSGDYVVRLVPYREALVCLFQTQIVVFGGNSPLDYYVRRFELEDGRGAICPNAVTVFDNAVWFLASDGLRVFDLLTCRRVSRPIDRLLSPAGSFTGAALTAAAVKRASLFSHAGRLYLSAPVAGGSVIGATFVFDTRVGGAWSRWLLGPVQGGFVLAGDGDTNDLYVYTAEAGSGQIYNIGYAFGDLATSGASVTAVAMTVRSRQYQEAGRELHAERLYLSVECAADTSATWTVQEGTQAGRTASGAYLFSSSLNEGETWRQKIPYRVKGRLLTWQLDVSTTGAFSLKRFLVECALGKRM